MLLSITFSLHAGAHYDKEGGPAASKGTRTVKEMNPIETPKSIRKMSELYTNPDTPKMVIKFHGHEIDFMNDPLLASIAEHYEYNCIKIIKALENAIPEFSKNRRLEFPNNLSIKKIAYIIAKANGLTIFLLKNGTAIAYPKIIVE